MIYTEGASAFKLELFFFVSETGRIPPKRKPRADSVRNRERLLEAARAVFAGGGPDASLEAVARTAGVGIGTLYRHFPTREALFEAVYRREAEELSDLAVRLAAEQPPVDAIRIWLKAAVRMVATKKGMIAALVPIYDPSNQFVRDSFAMIKQALADLMDRAQAGGHVRADISSEDVMRALFSLCHALDQPGRTEGVIQLLDVFVDGLATPPKA